MKKTGIEWSEYSWNPVSGCTKHSTGCKHCYAERISNGLQKKGVKKYEKGFGTVVTHAYTLSEPAKLTKPTQVFVNSMSDLFHRDVPDGFIHKVFEAIERFPQHTFQILTKRSERMKEFCCEFPVPDNVWLGVTVETLDFYTRINDLREIPCVLRFLSLEPLLSSVGDINLDRIDWVIVGGESGYGSRWMEVEWVRQIRDVCLRDDVLFFFKQWSCIKRPEELPVLDGETWSQRPI
jgi:protein gp37